MAGAAQESRGSGRTARGFKRIGRIIIMAIITASVLSACGTRPEDRESRAKAALEQKYHREFEIIEVYPQKFGDLYYEVQACAVDEPEVRFTASVDTEDDMVSDTYVERRVCAAITQGMENNLDTLPGYYYLFTQAVGPQPITSDAEISIEGYAALDPYNRFQINLFAVPEEASPAPFYASVSRLFEGLEYLAGSARLYVVNAEQMQAVQDYLAINDKPDMEYKQLTRGFFSVDIPYEKGTIKMTEAEFTAVVRDVL